MDVFDDLHVLESEPLELRSYGSAIYLYPSLVLGGLCGLLSVLGSRTPENPGILGTVFVVGVFFNFSVLAFKYTKRTSANVGWALLASLALAAIFESFGDLVSKAFTQSLFMNGSFYGLWTIFMGLLLGLAFGTARMDTWTIQGTELVRNHGIGDSERHPVVGLKVVIQTDDLAAYGLLRAGHISIYGPPGLPVAHFTNVPHVKAVEAKLRQQLIQAQSALPSIAARTVNADGEDPGIRASFSEERTNSISAPPV